MRRNLDSKQVTSPPLLDVEIGATVSHQLNWSHFDARYGDNIHQGRMKQLFAPFPNYAELPHKFSLDAPTYS